MALMGPGRRGEDTKGAVLSHDLSETHAIHSSTKCEPKTQSKQALSAPALKVCSRCGEDEEYWDDDILMRDQVIKELREEVHMLRQVIGSLP